MQTETSSVAQTIAPAWKRALGAATSSAPGRYIASLLRTGEANDQKSITTDGKMLFALLALILLGPYLPILSLVEVIGIDVADGFTEARLDNLALPLVGLFVAIRALVTRRVHLPIHLIWYIAFLAWIALMTVVWWSNMPSEYAGENARGIGLLKSVDAYGRPATILLIAANVRITRQDFKLLVQLVLGVGLLLGIISAAQLLDTTSEFTNKFLFNHYDNNPGPHFWKVLNQGRVAALMPQLSTLGMYAVLGLALLAAQVMGSRSVSSIWLYAILSGGVFLAGMLSGSKVFVGGTGMLAVGLVLFIRSIQRDSLPKIVAGLAAILIVWGIGFEVFPQSARAVAGLAVPRPPTAVVSVPDVLDPVAEPGAEPGGDSSGESDGSGLFDEVKPAAVYDRFFERFYIAYLASRFDSTKGKVFRTGATDIAGDYPITGLGLNVVNRTTDSMALGIFIMGGTIGSVLYLGTLAALAVGLLRIAKRKDDPDSAAMARVLLILTIAFLVMSVGFHTFIQDRAGDAYWLFVGLLLGPLAFRTGSSSSIPATTENLDEA